MASFTFDPIYIFLNLLLLYIFYKSGVNVSNGHNYWLNAKNCILAFTLVLGARYMRGNDYAHYLKVYKYDLEETQWVYTYICDIMKFIGINEYCSFFIYAFVFSLCLFILLKRFKGYAKYLFPLSLMFLLFFHEFMIRQAFSYSFIFIYMNKLFSLKMDKKFTSIFSYKNLSIFIWCILLFIIIAGIHSANIIVLMVFTISYLFIRKPIPWFITIPSLIISTYFISKYIDFSFFNSFLSVLGENDSKFANYTDNSNMFFSTDAKNDIYKRNPIFGFTEVLGYISLFYFSPKIIKMFKCKPSIITFFNCCVFGCIFQAMFNDLEILNRMGFVFKILTFVPLALTFAYKKYIKTNKITTILYYCLFFLFYDYLKLLFFRGNMTKFLWDM